MRAAPADARTCAPVSGAYQSGESIAASGGMSPCTTAVLRPSASTAAAVSSAPVRELL